MLTECCIKVQNKACWIIICYFELKLKNIKKAYETVDNVRLDQMVLLHGINNNIIFPHPYYSSVYQYEAKKIKLYKVINVFWGQWPKPKNW